MLELENIKKSYGDLQVLDVPSWNISRGDSVALLGANATGKTTMLEIIAGLNPEYEGTVKLDGKQISGPTRKIGIVLQNPVMFSTSVAGNICFGLKGNGVGRSEWGEKISEALKMVGLEGLEPRNAHKLSEGQKQRVAIARTLVLNPEFLLLDEPSASVDRESAFKIAGILKTLNQKNGVTVIVATHDLEFAQMVATRADILKYGRPVPYIAGNIFSGKASVVNDETVVTFQSGTEIIVGGSFSGAVDLAIPPEQIVLSNQPLTSSMRNSLAGKIISLSEDEGRIQAVVDVGAPLVTVITRSSLTEMGVSIGDIVYASFKAHGVMVFPRDRGDDE